MWQSRLVLAVQSAGVPECIYWTYLRTGSHHIGHGWAGSNAIPQVVPEDGACHIFHWLEFCPLATFSILFRNQSVLPLVLGCHNINGDRLFNDAPDQFV